MAREWGHNLTIQEQLKDDHGPVILEYGVPLDSMPYKRVEVFEENFDITAVEFGNVVANKVEQHFIDGRPGSFAVRRIAQRRNDADKIEIYTYAD